MAALKASVFVDSMAAVSMMLLLMSTSCAYNFYVGGRDGWVQNPSENFNHWAERNRFQVNDTLVFRYKKGEDSVLVVNEAEYQSCNTSNPIRRYDDGDSVFKFDRSGPFFFISGTPGRCESGQRLIVVVLAIRPRKPTPSNPASPPAPSPSPLAPSPLPSPPNSAPAPSPLAAPTPSPLAAPAPSPKPAATPSPLASPSPSPSTPHAPSPSTEAPSPSTSHPSPAPSPSLSPSPPVSEPVPSPATPREAPSSSSSYTSACLWASAAAVALGAVTLLAH